MLWPTWNVKTMCFSNRNGIEFPCDLFTRWFRIVVSKSCRSLCDCHEYLRRITGEISQLRDHMDITAIWPGDHPQQVCGYVSAVRFSWYLQRRILWIWMPCGIELISPDMNPVDMCVLWDLVDISLYESCGYVCPVGFSWYLLIWILWIYVLWYLADISWYESCGYECPVGFSWYLLIWILWICVFCGI